MCPRITVLFVIFILTLILGLLGSGITVGSNKEITYLDQGFNNDLRQKFYHSPQGTRLLPYSWFLALEQATNSNRVLDDENLKQLGIIPDYNPLKNPDRLPVGFAKTYDSIGKETWVGLTCAACHTSEVSYKDQIIRIDGGPSLFDAMVFAEKTFSALDALVGEHSDEAKFYRFSKAVLKDQYNEHSREILKKAVKGILRLQDAPQKMAESLQIELYPTDWGSGRLDALGRGGNSVLLQLHSSNLRSANAPVSFPAIWNTWTLNWVQWNGAVMQPMGRNLLQAIGLNANLVVERNNDQFKTSVNIKDLAAIEEIVQSLQPPVWPSQIFKSPIDQEKAGRGSKLYEQHCSHCHVPKLSLPNKDGRRFKVAYLIPLNEIGTDPLSASNFHNRTVNTGPLGLGLLTVADTAEYLTSRIMAKQYLEYAIPEDQEDSWNGNRQNRMQAPLAYIARPHSGVWALAPYLHNGSIPNLYQLLSPLEERENFFYVGHSDFDPLHVGYETEMKDATDFKFDTTLPGNSNSGHEFRDGPRQNGVIGPTLSEAERWGLIEYLKTL